MAALDVKMILSLVDKASGPAKGIMGRLFGQGGKGGIAGGAVAATGAMSMLNRSIAAVGAGAAGYVGFKSIIGGAVEFEASMAEVRKLVSGTPQQIADIEKAIKRVASTSTVGMNELAGLVAQAGQFGIPTEDLVRFAQFGAKAASAFQMSAEQTGSSLAQIRAAFGLNLDQLEELGDKINYVADTAASSEEQLVDVLLRTAANARAAGVTSDELLAMGSALTSVGISSQRAATALNSILSKSGDLEKKGGEFLDKVGGKGYSASLQRKFYDSPKEALVEMFATVKKLKKEDAAEFYKNLFGLETQDEAKALAAQTDAIAATLEGLKGSDWSGSIQRAADIFENTVAGQWQRFQNNMQLWSADKGANFLSPIRDTLAYLNNFFSTADGRVNVFERLSTAANGFFNGLGFKGGTAEALGGITDFLREVRDLLFGIEGDGLTGDKLGEVFHKWQTFGESLRNSPLTTLLSTIGDIDGAGLAVGLGGAALGLGAFGLAAGLALMPLRGVWAAMKGIAAAAKLLSGYSIAKAIFGGGGGKAGRDSKGRYTKGGGGGGWLGLLGRATPWAAALLASGSTADNSYLGASAEDRKRMRDEANKRTAELNARLSHSEERERGDLSGVANGGLWSGLGGAGFLPPGPAGPNAFDKMLSGMDSLAAKATTTGSEMQSALSVTATPVVDPASIDAALEKARQLVALLGQAGATALTLNATVGNRVGAAIRQNLADGGQ